MPGPDPFAPLPPELDAGPIWTPIGPFGPGAPVQPGAQALAQQAALARLQVPVHGAGLAGPGSLITPGGNVAAHVAPTPAAPTPIGPGMQGNHLGLVDTGLAKQFPSLPGPGPGPAYGGQMPMPVQAPVPARAGGGGSGGGGPRIDANTSDLDKQYKQAYDAEGNAIGNEAQVTAEGLDKQGQAIADRGVQRQANAADLMAEQARVRGLNQKLDAIDNENLRIAKEATVPNFWKGRTGALVGSAIAVALSGAASALLGQTGNSAADIISKNIDKYMYAQKDRIDNLFKAAEMGGKINDQTRRQYAQELLNLKDQHTYLLEAANDRIEQVVNQSKGAANIAHAKTLQAQLQKNIIDSRVSNRKLNMELLQGQSRLETDKASRAASYANAAESRASAALKQAQAAADPLGLGKPSGEMLKAQGYADTASTNHEILKTSPLSQKGLETILKDQSLDQVMKASPLGIASAQTLGMWRTLEQKLSPADQRALIAARQFINADLRRESGAAIGVDEFRSAYGRYITSVGDSPESIKQKESNRLQSIHAARVMGGLERGGQPVQYQGGQGQDQFAQARAWLAANPNDPRAAQVRAKIGQ